MSVPERRAVSSYSFETAPGKPCANSHSARRSDESAVLRSAACGRSSPSATPITLNTATVLRQQGLRLVFRDPVLTHLRHSTLPGSPAATVPERGRCALPSASSPLPSSPQAACTAAPRASGQCPAPPSTDPPPKAEDRRRSLSKVHGLSREPLTRRPLVMSTLIKNHCPEKSSIFVFSNYTIVWKISLIDQNMSFIQMRSQK